jgi:preprotein translocase subunit SecD
MLENVGRKVALIVVLLLVSIGLIVLPEQPFRLGLDLQGGTRIVYRIDFEAAIERGEISANEDRTEILAQTKEILRQRLDPTGTREVPVRTESPDRIIIELPGNTAIEGTAQADAALAQPLDWTAQDALVLDDAAGFSSSGVVQIGEEQIRYDAREGNTLRGLTRAHNGVRAADHAAGASVALVNADAIRQAIENLGELAFLIVAEERDFAGSATDLASERTKLDEWLQANAGASVVAFNRVPPDGGGPDPRIRWYPTRWADEKGEPTYGEPTAALTPKGPEDTFRGEALQRIYNATDNFGYPAVGFEVRPERIDDFADFTGENLSRRMAIVLNDEVRSAPSLNAKLIGGGIIEGRFKDEEVRNSSPCSGPDRCG